MTDSPAQQASVGEILGGPLTDEERVAAQQLHDVVTLWACTEGNLAKEVQETFLTMCKNQQFSPAYLILRQRFGESDAISIEQMRQMAAWHSFTERGFAPTAARPNV